MSGPAMRHRRGSLAWSRAWTGYRWVWVGFGFDQGSVRRLLRLGWWAWFVPRWYEATEADWKWQHDQGGGFCPLANDEPDDGLEGDKWDTFYRVVDFTPWPELTGDADAEAYVKRAGEP